LSLPPRETRLEEVLSQLEDGSKVLLIQLPGNNKPRLSQTNLHICTCRLEELVSLTERRFTQKTSSNDQILFTKLEKGSTLLERITRDVLEECMGKAGAALIDKSTSERPGPLKYGNVITALPESMGSSAELIKRAISKALYHELKSNPGALEDE
jgi:hypothetical protein